MRGKAEKKTKMFSLPCLLYSIVPTAEVFREAKNAPNSCSVGALPRAPLGELMTTGGDAPLPFPSSLGACGVLFSARTPNVDDGLTLVNLA